MYCERITLRKLRLRHPRQRHWPLHCNDAATVAGSVNFAKLPKIAASGGDGKDQRGGEASQGVCAMHPIGESCSICRHGDISADWVAIGTLGVSTPIYYPCR